MITLGRRYVRWVYSDPVLRQAQADTNHPVEGWVQTVNERIDESVLALCRAFPGYRPLGLIEWSKRTGRDLEALIENPDAWGALTRPIDRPGIELRPPSEGDGS